MNFILLTLLLIQSSALTCEELVGKTIYSVEDAFSCINSVPINKTAAEAIKKDITGIFETYVYKDILKALLKKKHDTQV